MPRFRDKDTEPVRWTVTLIVLAVVLPSVCLLWFMGQVMQNERLAIRQKLIDSYTARADRAISQLQDQWQQDYAARRFPGKPLVTLRYDKNGEWLFPSIKNAEPSQENGSKLKEAWRLEFVEKDLSKAKDAYERLNAEGVLPFSKTLSGKARVLKKQGRLAEAAEAYRVLAWPEEIPPQDHSLIAQARVMQLRLYQSLAHPDFSKACRRLAEKCFGDLKISTEQQVFLLEEFLEVLKQSGVEALQKNLSQSLTRQRDELRLALQLYEVASPEKLKATSTGTLFPFPGDRSYYAVKYEKDHETELLIFPAASVLELGKALLSKFENDELVAFALLEQPGRLLLANHQNHSENDLQKPFYQKNLSGVSPAWTVAIRFGPGAFGNAVDGLKRAYLVIAVLVILAMTALAGLVISSLLRQSRLNRLKNDFVATVTHELKTPLASIRVLVDTLLSGKHEDRALLIDYLGLISKENLRLSRLIENFLSFSRMQRNKQSFELTPTDPREIAQEALEAIGARHGYSPEACTFSTHGPKVKILADREAMVTVLVNLLDNAFKNTTPENRRIKLKVHAAPPVVRFVVSDNGQGMTARQMRHIFERFYQADSSLARQSEGCGLGLSIVRFIVDAHHATIDVQSKPKRGSHFTITFEKTDD